MLTIYLIIVVTSVLVGAICAAVAQRRGKDPVRWFWAGALLNALGVMLILVMKRQAVRVDSARR